ncbi:MAG: DUF5107 domain-containing protein [Chloroflexales bacterium]|nr:DUF5107 domain-containing protein [Chloroflexales bacterium]
MSTLKLETLTMPAANLGSDNPLPLFKNIQELHEVSTCATDIPVDMRHNVAYGRVANLLPYTQQDGYDRSLEMRDFRVAVLENELLKATFLLELGGRLWSLIHKPSGKELLYANPVFQPANLALRNAWFSGGVEWNIGTIGHSPFTCSPLFAAHIETPEGMPILRLYEWERIRQTPFQIDAYLPDGSPLLFVHIRISNPHPYTTPMYWWSNIAVPETPDTRVVAPADTAYRFGYRQEGLRRFAIPVIDGVDVTYTTRSSQAFDLFFHIPDDHYHWITALNQEGKGLVQVSTNHLRGRKLFLWGAGKGGTNWQRFLSPMGQTYLEIQAGLARTQLEHLPMPPNTTWSWLEGYGLLEADPALIHAGDWKTAYTQVQRQLAALMPEDQLLQECERSQAWMELPPTKLIQRGAGWGALERLRREKVGQPPFCSAAMLFDDDSLGAPQLAWRAFLEQGAMNDEPFEHVTPGYLVQPEWRDLLEASVQHNQAGWTAWHHLGVMYYHIGDTLKAREAWAKSCDVKVTPWALRGLALLNMDAGLFEHAADLYVQAHQMLVECRQLAVETGHALLRSGQAQRWLELVQHFPATYREDGRIILLQCRAALALKDFDQVQAVLNTGIRIVDLREGEDSLTALWNDFHLHRLSHTEQLPIDDALRRRVARDFPMPETIDYRMASGERTEA